MAEKAKAKEKVEDVLREVYAALSSKLNAAFPEFGWKKVAEGEWVATDRDFTKRTFDARPDRVVCNRPHNFYVHGGGPTSWLAYVNGGEFPRGAEWWKALRSLAEKAGMDLSRFEEREASPEERERAEKSARRAALLEAFGHLSREELREDAPARAYLHERGFTDAEIADQALGVCPSAEEVRDYLTRPPLSFGVEEVREAGLLPPAFDSGTAKVNDWPGRVVGPLRDRDGTLRNFWARDTSGAADPGSKYLYLAGAPKGELVAFGLDHALRHGGKADLVLVEGVLDMVRLHARGFGNAAALGGTTLSTDGFEKLRSFGVKKVTLALDNDGPGRAGALVSAENAAKSRKAPKVYVLDPGELEEAKDPDEFVQKNGAEAFRQLLKRSPPGATFRALAALGSVSPSSPDHERREAVGRVLDLVAGLRGEDAALEEEDALRVAAERTGYSVEALAEVAKSRGERAEKDAADKALGRVLRDAQEALRAESGSSFEIAEALAEHAAKIRPSRIADPPAFSVDGLLRETRDLPDGKRTGWASLDAAEVVFRPGEFGIVAARTGHAKTTFLVALLLQWLEAENADPDERLVFYSHEEPTVRIFHRLLASLTAKAAIAFGGDSDGAWSSVSLAEEIRGREVRYRGDPDYLRSAQDQLRRWEDRLLVVHRPAWDADEIAAHARRVAEGRKVGAVLVDYLQRVPPPALARGRNYDRRDMEVSAIGREFKAISEALSAPVVAGAQINRDAAKNVDPSKFGESYADATSEIRKGRPELHHLREGGSEQEADVVLGLLNYAADYKQDTETEPPPKVTLLEVGVLKNRFGGGVGRWCPLAFEGRYTFVREPEEREKASLRVETKRKKRGE